MKKGYVQHLHVSEMSHTDEVTYLRNGSGQMVDKIQVF